MLARYEKEKETSKNDVKEAEQKWQEALEKTNERLIAFWEKRLADRSEIHQKILDKIQEIQLRLDEEIILSPAIVAAYNQRIISALGLAEFIVPEGFKADSPTFDDEISKYMHQALGVYGGYLSINAYGGFTKSELEALRQYKLRYNPYIRVSLLPIDELSFFPLTEFLQHANDATTHAMFSSIKGSGDFLGANIVMNMSLLGAIGFAQHLSQFILPVGVKATFKRYIEPTEAELSCNFSNGYLISGKAELRNRQEFYDNIDNVFTVNDSNKGKCDLKLIRGDYNAAEFQALMDIDNILEAAHFHKTNLTFEEKKAYYAKILEDIKNHRMFPYFSFANGSNFFHRHINAQNVKAISELKFSKTISIKGTMNIERQVPVNLCLVYNKESSAYDRCTEIEKVSALSMQEAIYQAGSSEECKDAKNAIDCGKKRDENISTSPARTHEKDSFLVNGI